jgi:hypothetical protein
MPEPVPDREAYVRALADFREMLDGPRVGVSTVPEVEQLRVLVRRYPDETRQILAEMDTQGKATDPA